MQNITISLTCPCCLPLGLVRAEGRPALLGITLQYPPVQMVVKPHNELSVTGARANLAAAQALWWFQHHRLPPRAEIEIEFAIPAHMGLGSEAMMGMSVAQALTGLHGSAASVEREALAISVGLGSEWRLETWSASKGGLLVVGTDGTLIRRHEIKHDDKNAWVFVMHLPHPPADISQTFEADRRAAVLDTAATVDPDSLWSALATDDAPAFANELMRLQKPTAAPPEAGTMLNVIRAAGALAWGQSLGGLAVWGLVRGAKPSVEVRQAMRRQMGYEGGTVMASITDNTGAVLKSD